MLARATDFSLSAKILEKNCFGKVLSFVESQFNRRKLPHWQPADTWIFVTWRLAGSEPRIPACCARGLTRGQLFTLLDDEADRAPTGPLWLTDLRIAQLVQNTITELSDTLYALAACAIMANHVHLVILPKVPLRKIMKTPKGTTAYAANRILGQKGFFWRDESYDHDTRSEREFNRIVRYVERNPVKAGLVDSIDHWRWSSTGQTKVCPTMR
jgi:REP element-mobilizing transposase RayT